MTKFVETTLGEVCADSGGLIQTGPFGSQLHQSDYSYTGIPVVMPADIKNGRIAESRVARVSEGHVERLKRHKLEVGDIVYGRRGDIGRQAIIRAENEGWLCGTGCLRLSLGENPRIISEYLHLFLSMPEVIGWIQNQAIGATMPNLNTQILKRVPLIFPEDVEAQKKIVAVVAAYDDLTENNKRRITLLENMAEEIYREWFVRFRFPGWQEAEFEKGYPASWNALKFDEFCKLKRGYDLPDSKVIDGPYPVLASTSVKTFHSEYKVKAPVITTGRSGSLGTVLFKRENCWPLNTTLYVQNFKGNSPFFIYFTLKNMPLETFNSGAGVPSLNRNHLAGLRVVVPGETTQKEFDEIVEPIFRQIDTLQEQSEHLLKTKNQLLPRLISGKLSVENLDIQFPPSMQSDESDSAAEAAA